MTALRDLPLIGARHAYDFEPTPSRPAVRLFPQIRFGPGCKPSEAAWIRDDGFDINLNVIAEMTAGVSHSCPDMSHNELCDVCKERHAFRWDDFFGYVCTLCEIKYPLRYRARGVNPWIGKAGCA